MTFECHKAYGLYGDSSRLCHECGRWSGRPTSCISYWERFGRKTTKVPTPQLTTATTNISEIATNITQAFNTTLLTADDSFNVTQTTTEATTTTEKETSNNILPMP